MQQDGLVLGWLGDAAFADRRAAAGGQDHVHCLNGGDLVQNFSRFVAQAGGLAHLAECFPELVSDSCDASVCFVLSVPTDGIPAARDAAVLRTIVSNREGFLRYLLLLLRDDGGANAAEDLLEMLGSSGKWSIGNGTGLPLLEELTKAFARDPNRLLPIKRMVNELLAAPSGSEVVPAEFLELWHLYEVALDDVSLDESQLAIRQGDLA